MRRERGSWLRACTGHPAGGCAALHGAPALPPRGHRGNVGGIPERPKGSDCKSDGTAFTGSNPVPPTTKHLSRRAKTRVLAFYPCCLWYIGGPHSGRSSMVERQPSKLNAWVRFPSPAPPHNASCCSSVVEHFLGKEEVMGSSPISSSIPAPGRLIHRALPISATGSFQQPVPSPSEARFASNGIPRSSYMVRVAPTGAVPFHQNSFFRA